MNSKTGHLKLAVRKTKRKNKLKAVKKTYGTEYTKDYIHCVSSRKRREREKFKEGLFEKVMSENFPNLGMDMDIKTDEAQNTPG